MKTLLPLALVAGPLALAAAHDGDPKMLDRFPRQEGSGFQRGLATGALLPGGGANPAAPVSLSWNQASSGTVTLEAQLTLTDLGGGSEANDCWGYTSPSGREYAIVGTDNATVFVEVTNPAAPVFLQRFTSPQSTWRDMKVHQTHCYVVSEGGGGIQVFDMSSIDAGLIIQRPAVTTGGTTASHNVALDEDSGFLYRCGGDNEGLRIYDLSNLDQPTFVGSWSDKYVHDAQVVTYTSGPLAGRELAFCCGGFNVGFVNTGLTIVDVTNKAAPVILDEISYPDASYSHQGWLSEDLQYFYLGDELDEQFAGVTETVTRVIDVSDPTNASFVGSFTTQGGAASHNMYTKGGRLYQANYTVGLQILEYAATPAAPVEVTGYDTSPLSDSSFAGLWSCFPYFDSGTVLGSDRQGGLFIWSTSFEPGIEYCAGVANSTGVPGRIQASGSADLTANDLVLDAVDLPPNQFAMFIAGQVQGVTQNPGGSAGNLCILQPIGRYLSSIASSGPTGSVTLQVDSSAMVTATGFVQASVGETWNFQAWHRDQVFGIATSNFTSGYAVTFQ